MHFSLTTLKRVAAVLAFHFHNPKVILLGKGMLNNIHCECRGGGNSLHIEAGSSLNNCRIFFKGNANHVHISSGSHLSNVTFWCEGDNNRIEIGRLVTMEGDVELDACEGKSIIIGDGCMLSHNIAFRTTDSHTIIDVNGKRINPAKDIIIGKHVWIGVDCMFLKGSTIPDNCIVGAKSLVSASLDVRENSLIAGNPARMIKENINWCRELL